MATHVLFFRRTVFFLDAEAFNVSDFSDTNNKKTQHDIHYTRIEE